HGIVDDYVVTSVKALHTAGCAVIVITTSNETGELQKLLPHCNSVLVKNDVGRDFGSWYLATKLQLDRFRRYQTVIWMNDSTYFPVLDLRRMFNVMDGRKLDLWGIVDSYNVRWHIMSWFWAFGPRVISSDWFESFIGEFNPAYSKWDQIRNYEMRYPNDFKNKGLAVDSYVRGCAVFDYVIKNCPTHDGYTGRMDFTMTHDYWDIIIKQFKCPALKVELLRDNPLGMDLSTVYETIRDYTEYDPEMIRRHIRRLHTAGRFPDRDYGASEMSKLNPEVRLGRGTNVHVGIENHPRLYSRGWARDPPQGAHRVPTQAHAGNRAPPYPVAHHAMVWLARVQTLHNMLGISLGSDKRVFFELFPAEFRLHRPSRDP